MAMEEKNGGEDAGGTNMLPWPRVLRRAGEAVFFRRIFAVCSASHLERGMNPTVAALGAFLLLCIYCIAWIVTRPTADAPAVPEPPVMPDELVLQKSEAEQRLERDIFFQADVIPIIKEADSHNREAADRCVARLKEAFDGYRSGIPAFCKEINTWGTRLGVMRRMPSDWWYEQTDVADYIREKFSKHLFNDKKVSDDIEAALNQYQADVEANQSTLITRVRAAISSTDLPSLPDIDYSEFSRDLSARLTDYSERAARDSVLSGIVTELAGGLGGFVADALLAQVAVRMSSMAATSTSAAGGATAGGAAVGGSGGSVGGPLGAVAGFAAGLVVGAVIDWWWSSSFEAKMSEQLNALIDALHTEAIAGDADRPGLRGGLSASCDALRQAYQESLRVQVVDGGS